MSATDAPDDPDSAGLLASTRAMAGGTVLSRVTGMLREPVVGAALGTGLLGDAYGVANVVPNILYILLVGGVLNAVFVPQLVRHMTDDPDGGDGYADRLITAVGLVLVAVTVLAVAAAPLIVQIYTKNPTPDQLHVATVLARYCLVQIFFYGVFTMYQQLLNSRGSFVVAMYAPILNNVVVIAVFVWFMATAGTGLTVDTITQQQLRLLGIGTTAGVVAQALVLLPAAARVGYRLRPRRDLRGHGLGHAWVLARWTIAFVLVNQLTYVLVTRLATGANESGGAHGTGVGFSVYTKANLLFILPHSIVTVSIVTALLPRMSRAAHDGLLPGVGRDIGSGVRTSCALVLPAAVGFLALGPYISTLLYRWGSTDAYEAHAIGVTLQALSVGLVAYTVFYVLLRGFYAVEDTRTPFWVNVVLNVFNAGFAVLLYALAPSDLRVPALGLALALSYIVTTFYSWRILSRRLGGLDTYVTVRAMVRLALASVVAFVPATLVAHGLTHLLGTRQLAVAAALLAGLAVAAVIFVPLTMRLGVPELAQLLEPLLRRTPLRPRPARG
ncbi:MAG TPA: murein biosynthesis integral membrane protein MurJ [Actinomycetes bacterium]|nr:murein biosynthesis integral membrane protein MurJ [Actinomycetes bacterium]